MNASSATGNYIVRTASAERNECQHTEYLTHFEGRTGVKSSIRVGEKES